MRMVVFLIILAAGIGAGFMTWVLLPDYETFTPDQMAEIATQSCAGGVRDIRVEDRGIYAVCGDGRVIFVPAERKKP